MVVVVILQPSTFNLQPSSVNPQPSCFNLQLHLELGGNNAGEIRIKVPLHEELIKICGGRAKINEPGTEYSTVGAGGAVGAVRSQYARAGTIYSITDCPY